MRLGGGSFSKLPVRTTTLDEPVSLRTLLPLLVREVIVNWYLQNPNQLIALASNQKKKNGVEMEKLGKAASVPETRACVG
jgi:hypothetical protein